MYSSKHRVAHQIRMQSETESAVFGLLSEDPSLPQFSPRVYSLFKKSQKYEKKRISSDDDNQKNLKLKAKYSREDARYHRREMEEKKRKEEERMKKWRVEQKKLEEMEKGKRRKRVRIVTQDQNKMEIEEESEDEEWTAYLRKNLQETRMEKELQKQEIKKVKRQNRQQKMKQKKNVRKEMEKKFNLNFYRYDKWRTSSSSTPKYAPNPLTTVMDTPVECTRFEDLILSESDEEVAKEVRFEDLVLSETEDEDDVFETPRRPATHFSSTIYTPESPTCSTPINSKSFSRISESFPALLTPISY
ncbi:hypothetical protein CAEBREN_12089 [Caenorhabditis brenneri]|uniref:Uncharacterized protein n=1 Tax=Caenorhabditis brenneri TaxID=135651 RepID=G0P9T9_CAEBE|nr:hypothetical protein CAEBREN_12089 [Caenorhabditis brenneri]